MKILVLNSGSSSQKSCLYELGGAPPANPPGPSWQGKIEWDADAANLVVENRNGAKIAKRVAVVDFRSVPILHYQIGRIRVPFDLSLPRGSRRICGRSPTQLVKTALLAARTGI